MKAVFCREEKKLNLDFKNSKNCFKKYKNKVFIMVNNIKRVIRFLWAILKYLCLNILFLSQKGWEL